MPRISLPDGVVVETTCNGRKIGFAMDNMYILATDQSLSDNPGAVSLLALVRIDINDVSAQNKPMADGAVSSEDIDKHVVDWIAAHQADYDAWLATPRAAPIPSLPVRTVMPGPAPLVLKGAAFHPVPDPGPTRSYAFILVPGFTLLDFSSAVEPLRIANQLSQRPLYRWRVLSESGGPVACSAEIPVGADGAVEALDKGTSRFICAGNPNMAATAPGIVAAVARHHRFGGVVGGICTGGFALAKASLVAVGGSPCTGRTSLASWRPFPAASPRTTATRATGGSSSAAAGRRRPTSCCRSSRRTTGPVSRRWCPICASGR